MAAIASVTRISDPYTNAVLGDYKWASGNLTYSFPATAASYQASYGENEPSRNFGALNATQQNVARAAFANYAAVANVTFSELTGSNAAGATLRLAMSDAPSTAWAYLPSTAAEGGDVWFNKSSGYYSNPVRGNYAYTTFLHEIGHTLGLEHPHENGMPIDRDSMEFTVMSYRSYVGASTTTGYTNESWGYAQTLMMYDIAAIQQLYGANFSTNSGTTTYSWSPTTGQMSINGVGQGAAGSNKIFQTVWDGGGVDTFDFSNYTTNLSIDLRPGAWSTVSSAQLAKLHYNGSQVADGNIANALQYNGDVRSLIENAVGGSGNDTITGNTAANVLRGNGGNDRLVGDAGSDTLYGGAGTDTAVFAQSLQQFHIYLTRGAAVLSATLAESDYCYDIEYFEFGNGIFGLGDLPLSTLDASDIVWRNTATGDAGYWDMYQGKIWGWRELSARSSDWQIIDRGDYTADGHDDILWRNVATGAVEYEDLSNGSYERVQHIASTGSTWAVQASRGHADLTNDGSDDVLWRDMTTGEVGFWETTGGILSGSGSFGSIPLSWRIESTGDFTNDGCDDILWRNTANGEVGFWDMLGGSISGWHGYGAVALNWDLEATGDYDGDGFTDILWRNTNTGELGFWDLNAGEIGGWTGFGAVSSDWQIKETRDYSIDGSEDILWRNSNTGEIGYWDLEGGRLDSWTGLGTIASDWLLV